MADADDLPAYPILAYQLIPDAEQPTVAALAFNTMKGNSLYLATREILEDLARDCLEQASKMPRRADRH